MSDISSPSLAVIVSATFAVIGIIFSCAFI